MGYFEQDWDQVSTPVRPLAGPPRRPVATPQTPSQDASSAASAAASAANANRTRALTPAEVDQARIQAQLGARDLTQGASPQQVNLNDLARQRADIEAMTNQLQAVGTLYNRNFRDNDPMISLGLSPTEREFDRNAGILRQQAQSAFRVPGVGSQSDFEAQQMEQAYGLDSRNWDTENEAILNGLTNRLNERRGALGLPPIDWRQASTPDPNRVQAGESMGQVGNLPPVTAQEREGAAGQNQLDNNGGLYETEQDRQRASQIAGHITAMARAGASPEQINQWLTSQRINPLPAGDAATLRNYQRRGRARDFPGFSPTVIPTGRSDPNFTTGIANTPLGAAVIGSGDALTFGLLDNATADPERSRAGMELLREQHPWESTVGEMVGSIAPSMLAERVAGIGIRGVGALRGGAAPAREAGGLATVGEMAARPAGNAAYGAAYGAGTADQPGGNRLLAALRGGAMAAAGGEVGDRFVAGAGRTLTGTRNAGIRYLNERGIPVTIGQIASTGGPIGRGVTRIENILESVPWLGDAIRGRRADSFQHVNRAAFDDALAPINANTGGVIGEQGVDIARQRAGAAYQAALNGKTIPFDQSFRRELSSVVSVGQRLPRDLQGHFRNFIENRVAPQVGDGHLTGEGFQALRQEIKQEIASVKGQLGERGYGSAMRQLGDTLDRLVRRQAPDIAPALNAADQAYRRTQVVRGAVGRAINNKEQGGIFTPGQLGLSARENARRFGGEEASTNRPFYELQRNAQNTLPATLPNSGTTDRAWVLQTFPALASGAAYQTGLVDAKTAALFAGLGIPYTRTGQRAFQKLLVSRPERVRQVGEWLIRQHRWGGRAGAGALNPIIDQTPSPNAQ